MEDSTMSKKPMTKKEYDQMQVKVDKMKFKLSEIKKKNPKLAQKIAEQLDIKTDTQIKLTALNSVIGYLVRKGADSGVQMEILIDIANDYEKRLKGNE